MSPVTLLCMREDGSSSSCQTECLLSSGLLIACLRVSQQHSVLPFPVFSFPGWVSKHSSPLSRVEINPDFLPYKLKQKKERMGKVITSPTTQDIENIISNKEKLVRAGGSHGEGAGKGGFHTLNPCIVPYLLPIHFTSSLFP